MNHPSITRLPLKRGDAYRAVISDETAESCVVIRVREPLHQDLRAYVTVETRSLDDLAYGVAADSGEYEHGPTMWPSVLPLIAVACAEAEKAAEASNRERGVVLPLAA